MQFIYNGETSLMCTPNVCLEEAFFYTHVLTDFTSTSNKVGGVAVFVYVHQVSTC